MKMRMKISKGYYFMGLCLLGWVCLFMTITAFAESEDQSPLGFTIQAIRPDTQIETNKSYFFIKTKPNISQKLQVKIRSTKKEKVLVDLSVTNAVTNDVGDIEYNDNLEDLDETLEHPITELVRFPVDEITVENFEEKVIDVTINPPKESYKGIKLGGLVFKLVDKDTQEKTVANDYQFRVAIMTSETGEDYQNAKALDLIDANFALSNGKKKVIGRIHNPEPKMAEKLKVIGTVTKKGSKNVLKSKIVQNARMAPNSYYDFNIDWGLGRVEHGEYTLKVQASNDDEKWEWSRDFSVSKSKAKQINVETFYKVQLPKWLPLAVFVNLTIIVILTIMLVARSSRWSELMKEHSRLDIRKKKGRKQKERAKANENVEK